MLFRSDRKSTRLNSSHTIISYAVFCLKKKKEIEEVRSNVLDAESLFPQGSLEFDCSVLLLYFLLFFFFNDTATTEIYTLSPHDAFPISRSELTVVTQAAPSPTAIAVAPA